MNRESKASQDAYHIDFKSRIASIRSLPAMPEVAANIIRLRNEPDAGVGELAEIVELDPALAAQIVHYACSPIYAYRGKVHSIEEAIIRVLGFDRTLNLAMGLSAGKVFHFNVEGPLSMQSLWRHAIYCAALMQLLAEAVSDKSRFTPGMVYLCGLLHNIGLLLMGHFFPPEYKTLNELFKQQPDRPLVDIEQERLSVDHTRLGAWLLRQWQMPAEVVVASFEHHNEHYKGTHAFYANLALLADRLLFPYERGDGNSEHIPESILHALGLTAEDCNHALDRLTSGQSSLDALAHEVAKVA